MSEKLGDLERTIREHAQIVARQEWEGKHKPVMRGVFMDAGLNYGGVLEVDGAAIPIEAIERAVREEFLRVRVGALVDKASRAVVEAAFRKVDGEDGK